jgi:hypothetical protein
MSKSERPLAAPAVPVDHYFQVRPLVRHIHIMSQVMQWVDANPEAREFYADLYRFYTQILQEEFAPHAWLLALAVSQLEEAFPEIAALGPTNP